MGKRPKQKPKARPKPTAIAVRCVPIKRTPVTSWTRPPPAGRPHISKDKRGPNNMYIPG